MLARGPNNLRFYIPLVEVLRELGGSGRSAEVTDLVLERMGISEAEQEATIKSGASRVRNQMAWVRTYLAKAGFISSSQRGVWTLTEKGRTAQLTKELMFDSWREAARQFAAERRERISGGGDEVVPDGDNDSLEIGDYKCELLSKLQSLPPDGFERICQRLLRESGFQQVVVTGKSGDGGIDGHGILQLNPLLSFKVLFQCKRYQGAVPVKEVRDFRGALQGRADKGIILSTGTFTSDAKDEAIRDGATPIELVDGEKLVDMFSELSLGLRPKPDFRGG